MPHSLVCNSQMTAAVDKSLPPLECPIWSTGRKMDRQGFKNWLRKFDSNDDERISKHELRDALKGLGLGWTAWKAWRAVIHADLNKNKSIDGDSEIEVLVNYAAKKWGIIDDE